jgi:hypothetical protein
MPKRHVVLLALLAGTAAVQGAGCIQIEEEQPGAGGELDEPSLVSDSCDNLRTIDDDLHCDREV